jgi:hypothetical protein
MHRAWCRTAEQRDEGARSPPLAEAHTLPQLLNWSRTPLCITDKSGAEGPTWVVGGRSIRQLLPPQPLRAENGQSAKSAQFQERDYHAAFLDWPPRMARCASKSFATPQSCFISIKVVAVGQRTRTNVD